MDPYYFDVNLDDEDKLILHKQFKNKLYDDLSEIDFDGIKYRKDVCLN